MAKRRALKLPKKIVKLKSGVRQSPDADPSLVQCRRPSSPRKYNEDQPRQPQQQGQSFKAMPTTGWWLDPAGTVHDVPGMVTHDEWIQQNMHKHPSLAGYQSPQDAEAESPFRDHAFAKGWQRLVHIPAGRSLIVENTKVKPNEKQLGAIADHASSLGSPKVEMYHPFERRSRMKEFLSRKGLPKRYAKVDGHEPAHHLVAGFPIEHALRHLANDPNNTSDVRDIAKTALTGKNSLTGEDTDVSSALWVLNDALNESNHPLRSPSTGGHGYNWMSAADKIHLDSHVHTALTEEGERMRKDHNEPHTSARDWSYRPEGQALRIHRGMTNQNDYGTLNSRAVDAYNRVMARTKSLSKVDNEDMIKESIKRHASRAAMTWRKEHDVGVKDDFYGSTNPPVDPTDYHGPRASDPVTRYAAKGDRGYSWMTPGGKYHPVVGMDTHEKLIKKLGYKDINDAYADGWQRIIAMGNVLYSHNPVRAPNGTQKSQLIDHALEERHEAVIHDNNKTSRVLWDSQDRLSRKGRPIKKSLAVRGDFIDSLRQVKSANIETLNKVAQQVAKKLGLHPITSLPALHDTRHGSVPGIAQAVYGHATPEQIHTAAAWIGSVGNLPGVMVHHIRPNGPDTLYKFRQTGSGLDIRQKLDRAGLVDRVIAIPQGEPSRVGFDIMIADKGNKYRSAVAQYAKQNGLQVQSSQGYIKTVGSQDQSQARDQYRTQIARGERMARAGQPIKYAIPARWYNGRKGIPHATLMKWLAESKPGSATVMPGSNMMMVRKGTPDTPNAKGDPESHRPKPQEPTAMRRRKVCR